MYPYINPIGNKDKIETVKTFFGPQTQENLPGIESVMNPLPIFDNPEYIGSNKLKDKVSIISRRR